METVRDKLKILLTVLCLSVAIPSIFSQNFHGGLMAGLVGSQVAGDTYSGYNKPGLFFGGYVNWDFTERSALELEIQYFQKGSRRNPDAEKNDYTNYLFRANYIELPVLYLFKLNKFVFFTGLSAGFLVGYYETDINGYEISYDESYNYPADFTLQFNLGARFYISKKFGVDFRFHDSLLNIRSKNVTGDVWRLWSYGQFHDALVLSLFYQFR